MKNTETVTASAVKEEIPADFRELLDLIRNYGNREEAFRIVVEEICKFLSSES